MDHSEISRQLLRLSMSIGLRLGASCGGVYGAVAGVAHVAAIAHPPFLTCLAVLIVTVGVNATAGMVVGTFIGAVNGLTIASVTTHHFVPLQSPRLYRNVITGLCATVSLAFSVYVCRLYGLFATDTVLAVLIQVLFVGAAWVGSRSVSAWYVKQQTAHMRRQSP